MTHGTTPLLLVAAGGLGREVAATVDGMPGYEVLGFVDDEPGTWGTVRSGALVLGPMSALDRHPEAGVVVCARRGADRARIRRRLADAGIDPTRFVTIVDPTVWQAPDVVVGTGSVVLAGSVLATGVVAGAGCVVMPNVTLAHDVVLEDHATVGAGACLEGGVVVERGASIGARATVRERATVGRGSRVGMGAVVLADVPDNETWAGVPARRVAARTEAR